MAGVTTIAFVGVGSTVLAQKLLGDLLSFPELAAAEIRLHGIDERWAELSRPDRLAEGG